MNPFASLPGNLGERAAAIVAKREQGGCNVHFIGADGQYDRFSFNSLEMAERFADERRREGRVVFADERERLAHEYSALVGYDPFAEGWTLQEVRETLQEVRALHAESR